MERPDPPSLLTGQSGPGSRSRRIAFFAVTGALVVGILWVFREVLAPFAIALIVAYVFAPLVERMQRVRIGGRKTPRWAAVLVLYLSLLGAMATTVVIGAPLVVSEIQKLSREMPRTVRTLRDEWLPQLDRTLRSATSSFGAVEEEAPPSPDEPDAVSAPEPNVPEPVRSIRVVPRDEGGYEIVLPDTGVEIRQEGEGHYVVGPAAATGEAARRDLSVQLTEALRGELAHGEQSVASALRTAQSFIAAVVGGIFRFFIMLMLSAYLLISADSILAFFRQLVRPDRRSMFDVLLSRIDRGLAGVVRGQLVICLVNGVLSGIGFYIAGLDYWPLLTLIATVLSIIPIFGAIISSIPAVVVGLQDGFGVALFVLAWIIGIHQVEANLLNPKILGDAAKVHPVLVVFALLAGEHFFGITGALLAVPVLSIGQSLFLHFREVALGVPASESRPGIDRPPASAADATVIAPPPETSSPGARTR
ncbi:AI-2E family transporter [Sandaracinus amylolyticus]|uniref:AI-2E family transporter n=1 Tax=Sandaracinus amylolyticus TaxID=927083 RepID=UPI00069E14D6|nr:AI-2E family transporter [Sandaracinus amylolyticus]